MKTTVDICYIKFENNRFFSILANCIKGFVILKKLCRSRSNILLNLKTQKSKQIKYFRNLNEAKRETTTSTTTTTTTTETSTTTTLQQQLQPTHNNIDTIKIRKSVKTENIKKLKY